METDIRRIGFGNIKFPPVDSEIPTADLVWTFDSEEIKFDSETRTFDENTI